MRIFAPAAMGRGLRGVCCRLTQPENPSMAAAVAENLIKSRRFRVVYWVMFLLGALSAARRSRLSMVAKSYAKVPREKRIVRALGRADFFGSGPRPRRPPSKMAVRDDRRYPQ